MKLIGKGNWAGRSRCRSVNQHSLKTAPGWSAHLVRRVLSSRVIMEHTSPAGVYEYALFACRNLPSSNPLEHGLKPGDLVCSRRVNDDLVLFCGGRNDGVITLVGKGSHQSHQHSRRRVLDSLEQGGLGRVAH